MRPVSLYWLYTGTGPDTVGKMPRIALMINTKIHSQTACNCLLLLCYYIMIYFFPHIRWFFFLIISVQHLMTCMFVDQTTYPSCMGPVVDVLSGVEGLKLEHSSKCKWGQRKCLIFDIKRFLCSNLHMLTAKSGCVFPRGKFQMSQESDDPLLQTESNHILDISLVVYEQFSLFCGSIFDNCLRSVRVQNIGENLIDSLLPLLPPQLLPPENMRHDWQWR